MLCSGGGGGKVPPGGKWGVVISSPTSAVLIWCALSSFLVGIMTGQSEGLSPPFHGSHPSPHPQAEHGFRVRLPGSRSWLCCWLSPVWIVFLPSRFLGSLIKWGNTAAVRIQHDSVGAAQCMPGTPQRLPYPDPRTMTINTPGEGKPQEVEVLDLPRLVTSQTTPVWSSRPLTLWKCLHFSPKPSYSDLPSSSDRVPALGKHVPSPVPGGILP